MWNCYLPQIRPGKSNCLDAYLIYVGRLCDQVYGYVFDSEGNIIAEREHFGHTEEEAREKLETQKATREQKFGVDSF